MKNLLATLTLLTAATASAQVNSPGADGFLRRAADMYDRGNFIGCIDQISAVDREALTHAEREQADWLTARAAVRTMGAGAAAHLSAFIDNYPASVHRQQARMLLADCLLETDPARALEIYDALDTRALTDDECLSVEYHKAYARLMSGGDADAAYRTFTSLARGGEYALPSAYYAGYIDYTRGNVDKAEEYFRAVPSGSPLGAYARYYLAQIAYARADYKETGSLASSLTAPGTMPADYVTEAWRVLGESEFYLGDKKRAAESLGKYIAAVGADNAALSARYVLGLIDYGKGDYSGAVAWLEPVTAVDDAMGQTAYLYIGEALMKQGDRDAAILAFDNARRMTHDDKVRQAAMYDYAVARFAGAQVPFSGGAEVFEEYLRLYPEGDYAATVQEYLVRGYLTDKNYEAALASVNRMKRPGPAVMAAKQQILYALGSRALAKGELESAADYLTQARALAAHSRSIDAQTALALGETRYRQGRYRESESALADYLSLAPQDDSNRSLGQYDMGYTRLALKDYAGAAEAFRRAADGLPDAVTQADALARLGDTYYYRSQWDRAQEHYNQAYDRNPAAGDYPLFQEGVMQGYRRDHKGKIATLDRMMREFPTSALMPDALLELTEAYQQTGQPSKAIAAYERVARDYPQTSQGRRASLQLALTLLNSGQRDRAVEAYREVIRRYPTSEEASMAADELKRIAADDGTLGEFASFLASIENAPQMDVAEAERLDFEAAEKRWLTMQKTDRLEKYLARYPRGSFRPAAFSYMAEANADSPARALEYASELVIGYPDSPLAEKALLTAADARRSLGLTAEALEDYRSLENRASTPGMKAAARMGIMRTAAEMGDHAAALSAADALLASSAIAAEDRTEVIFAHGMAQDMAGDHAAARADWRQIASLTDELYGAKGAYYLAESYFSQTPKDMKKAREGAEALIDAATPHTYWLARAFILLSDIHAAEGRTFEAREYLRSLRENYPGQEADIFQMIDSRLSNLK